PQVAAGGPAGVNRGRIGGTRRKRGRRGGGTNAADSANAPGRVGADAGPGAVKGSSGAAVAARGATSRSTARGLFSTDGAPKGVHPGWRRNHAMGCGGRDAEDAGGTAGVGYVYIDGAVALQL